MKAKRIAICGVHIESSTFSPYISTKDDFTITRGKQLLARYEWLSEDWAQSVEWVPILHCRALPGGVVDRLSYEAWETEILNTLAVADPLDGIFFDIHGAMTVVGYSDLEGHLITRIRQIVGYEPMVSASMDLHGNVSEALFNGCDLLTCYRMAPHEDAAESRRRAAKNLVDRIINGTAKPVKALVHIPILLPGEKTSTRVEPAKSLYGKVSAVECLAGILDAAIWVGFAWADQPRCKAAVVVTGDDSAQVAKQAKKLAEDFWQARYEFKFVAPVGTMTECLTYGLTAAKPFFISDSGDNPGAGGAGDVTEALAELLAWSPVKEDIFKVVYASIFDPDTVAKCAAAGLGKFVNLDLGGYVAPNLFPAQSVYAQVMAFADDPVGGLSVVVKIDGLQVIVTTHRNQYSRLEQFTRLGIDISELDLVVVKMGYLEPDLFETQADWMMALTPGGVDQNLVRLGHQNISRPMFPFDPLMTASLEVKLIKPN